MRQPERITSLSSILFNRYVAYARLFGRSVQLSMLYEYGNLNQLPPVGMREGANSSFCPSILCGQKLFHKELRLGKFDHVIVIVSGTCYEGGRWLLGFRKLSSR